MSVVRVQVGQLFTQASSSNRPFLVSSAKENPRKLVQGPGPGPGPALRDLTRRETWKHQDNATGTDPRPGPAIEDLAGREPRKHQDISAGPGPGHQGSRQEGTMKTPVNRSRSNKAIRNLSRREPWKHQGIA